MPNVVFGEDMEKIKIGKIVNAVALKGEVKVYNYSDGAERYGEVGRIIAGGKEYPVESVRTQGNMVILKLRGVDDRNAAEVTEDDLGELPEDTFYIRDLIGLKVINAETGKEAGEIIDVIQGAAQDVYRIRLSDKECGPEESGGKGSRETMVPAVSEFVKDVNLEEKRVYIKFIEGRLLGDEGKRTHPLSGDVSGRDKQHFRKGCGEGLAGFQLHKHKGLQP